MGFWEKFREAETAALETQDGKAFVAAGFRLYPNGGGCTAWCKEIGTDGRCILITDSEGCTHDLSPDGHAYKPGAPDCWLVGLHLADPLHDCDVIEAATVAEAIGAAAIMALADRFAAVLQGWLSPEEWADMCKRNATPDYAGDICASHDFCDANMAMAEAFEGLHGRAVDMQADADLALWGNAWQMAKAQQLTAQLELAA